MRRVLGCLLVLAGCGAPGTGDNAIRTPACPAVACEAGAQIRADLPLSIDELEAGRFELCVDEQCFESRRDAHTRPPSAGMGFVLSFPAPRSGEAAAMSGRAELIISNDAGGPSLQLDWYPRSDAELHDGDHYRLTFTDAAGEARTLLETDVDYEREVLSFGPGVPEACNLTCHRAELDLSEPDRVGAEARGPAPAG